VTVCPSRTMENLSPSGECEEGKLEERRCDSMLRVHGNNTDNQVSILQLLDTDLSSVGAQQPQKIREKDNEKRAYIMKSSLEQSSVLTACAVDRGVKMTPPVRVNNCLTVCRREEVIKRCDGDYGHPQCLVYGTMRQCSTHSVVSLLARHLVAIIAN